MAIQPLKEKYFVIYIYALFLNLRMNTVEKEALHIALGIHLIGKKRESWILDKSNRVIK